MLPVDVLIKSDGGAFVEGIGRVAPIVLEQAQLWSVSTRYDTDAKAHVPLPDAIALIIAADMIEPLQTFISIGVFLNGNAETVMLDVSKSDKGFRNMLNVPEGVKAAAVKTKLAFLAAAYSYIHSNPKELLPAALEDAADWDWAGKLAELDDDVEETEAEVH